MQGLGEDRGSGYSLSTVPYAVPERGSRFSKLSVREKKTASLKTAGQSPWGWYLYDSIWQLPIPGLGK